MCDRLIELMSDGCSVIEVAAELGVTRAAMYLWAKDPRKPEFAEAMKHGKDMSEAWWMTQGRLNINNNKFNAAVWYMNMKNRFGWSDNHSIKQSGEMIVEHRIINYAGALALIEAKKDQKLIEENIEKDIDAGNDNDKNDTE